MVERERYVPELKGLFAFLPSFTGYSVSSCDVRGLVTGAGGLRMEWQAGAVLSESSGLLGGGRIISDTHECFWDNKAARMQRVTVSRGDFWMAWKVPLKSWYQSWDLSGKKELAIWTGLGRVFPAEGKLRAKCPRQEQSWCVLETGEMPTWPECRDWESGWHRGQTDSQGPGHVESHRSWFGIRMLF